ncbi:MAG TPA: hypothetical protein VJ873_10675 [bacterium]|nr:hypothetical protein [bacterium]
MKDPASFVKITAGLFLALSVICILTDSFFLVFMHLVWNAGSSINGMFDSFGPVYAWLMTHMVYYYDFHFLVSLVCLVGSLAILLKKAWSMSFFSTVLFTLILFHLFLLIVTIATLCSFPDQVTLNGMDFPRSLMVFSQGFGILIQLALSGLYFWLWTGFRKKEVRELYD